MIHNSYRVEAGDFVLRKIDFYITQAVAQCASDIHYEPTKEGLRIRFRIDGILHDYDRIALDYVEQCLTRLKILARVNSIERRVPQDGKFSLEINGKLVDFRVSTFPSLYGEKIVVRILDRAVHSIDMNDLGFADDTREACNNLLSHHQGIFLVTGPTGSGKTTTLYAFLSDLHSPDKNIVTLEDPVEYALEGITQGQINPDIGFTFDAGIRAVLRQDPDVLMVGEIRDKQTARVAIEASLTGHLIMSTLHTNDSIGALIRLIDMGVDPYLLNASLIGVLAQRLVRLLCAVCKKEDQASSNEKKMFGVDRVMRPVGCTKCSHKGYKGRTGIFELLVITPEIRAEINIHPDKEKITQLALAQGTRTLLMGGLTKLKAGVVSPQELLRVIV